MKICICDDNLLHSMKLEEMILDYTKKFLNLSVEVDVYTSAKSLIAGMSFDGTVYQILFLDIEMEEMNGIEAARHIRKKDKSLLIIYVTSYNKYTLESFEVSPFRYLLKPVDNKQIEQVLSKAIDEIMINNQYLFFKHQKMEYQMKSDCIIAIVCENGRMVRLITNNESMSNLFYGKIKEIENKLNPLIFVKVNPGTIINLNFVHIISGNDIHLENGEVISISRGQKKIVKEAYNDFVNRRTGI